MLTATGIPLGYLYGMTVESDWRPGTGVTMTLGDRARLTGDVLVAERPCRLSYTLGDRPGQPSVYVNWELRALGDATIVRLYVDEPWPDADPADDLEVAWLPVLYDLVAYLDWVPGDFRQIGIYRIRRGLRFATVRIDTAFPTIAHRADTSRRDIPGHCSGFTVACARAQTESASRQVRRVAHAGHGHLATRLANLYAAMPSLHVAWATWCAVAVITATPSR